MRAECPGVDAEEGGEIEDRKHLAPQVAHAENCVSGAGDRRDLAETGDLADVLHRKRELIPADPHADVHAHCSPSGPAPFCPVSVRSS